MTYLIATLSLFVCSLCFGCSAPKKNAFAASARDKGSQGGLTTPHPGRIVHHYLWNGKDEVVDGSTVPDTVKWVYYDAHGSQTSDVGAASYRVPIVEVEITSLDVNGKPVAPNHATRFFMSEYGPQHKEVRHTTASAPGK